MPSMSSEAMTRLAALCEPESTAPLPLRTLADRLWLVVLSLGATLLSAGLLILALPAQAEMQEWRAATLMALVVVMLAALVLVSVVALLASVVELVQPSPATTSAQSRRAKRRYSLASSKL